MTKMIAALFVVAVAFISVPSARGQDLTEQLAKERARVEAEARARAEALQAQKVALAQEIMQARQEATGREPFAPSFTAYWVDRLSKLSLEQLNAIAASGTASNLTEAVVNAETGGNGPLTPAAGFGDSGDNLVFTRITPCRIADSRLAGGALVAGSSRNFVVAGAAGFDAQGGNATGCGIPIGATGVALNLTVTQTAGAGDLRAWPYGASPAAASVINYKAANTLANGLIVPICDPATATCGSDLTVAADTSDSQIIMDVMGYFLKPAALGTMKTFTNETTTGYTTWLPDGGTCINYQGGSVTVVAPGPGEILVTARVEMYVNHTNGTQEYSVYGIATTATSCSGTGFTFGNGSFLRMTPGLPTGGYLPWDTVTYKYTVTAAGTYTFYLNGYKSVGASSSFAFNWGGMKATFNPQ